MAGICTKETESDVKCNPQKIFQMLTHSRGMLRSSRKELRRISHPTSGQIFCLEMHILTLFVQISRQKICPLVGWLIRLRSFLLLLSIPPHSLHDLPTIFPEVYKHGEIIEGDENSTGCVRHFKYVLPGTSEVLSVKIKTTEIDDENLIVAYFITEGDLTNHFKHMAVRIVITPKGEGCTVKWVIEYEKHHDQVLDPDDYLGVCVLVNDILDAYLHKP